MNDVRTLILAGSSAGALAFVCLLCARRTRARMSLKRDIEDLVRAAYAQGFKNLGIDGAGHRQLEAPDGSTFSVSSSPRSKHTILNDRQRMISRGFAPPGRPPKKKKKKASNPQEARKEDQMPKFEELVRITPPKQGEAEPATPSEPVTPLVSLSQGEIMPKGDIIGDLNTAGWLVWQTIMDEILEEPDHSRTHMLGGRTGYTWQGSLNKVISQVWPDLERPDYTVKPVVMPEARRLLRKYVQASANLAVLQAGHVRLKTTWWVAETWTNHEDTASVLLADNTNWWWESGNVTAVTPQDIGTGRAPAPVVVTQVSRPETIKCDGCAFETLTMSSLGAHRSKMSTRHGGKNKPHHGERYPCPITGCFEVRSEADSIRNHIQKEHKDLGLFLCRKCIPYGLFTSATERRQHSLNEHRTLANGRVAAPEDIPVSRETTTAATQETTKEPVAIVQGQTLSPFDPVEILSTLLDEVKLSRLGGNRSADLENEISDLRVQLEEAENQLEELKTSYAKVFEENKTLQTINDELETKLKDMKAAMKAAFGI